MSGFSANYVDPEGVRQYVEKGPTAFAPGHDGMLQMTGVLLAESVPPDGHILVVGAGGGLEIRYLAGVEPGWKFTGIDPASAMLDLARAVAGPVAGERLSLIEGTVVDAPLKAFDGATCILVLGLVPDDGGKLSLLKEVHRRLTPGAPFILVDQCIDLSAPDAEQRLDRYAAYARRSGIDAAIVANARAGLGASTSMATDRRNEELLSEAGFRSTEVFYAAMAWRGWVSYA